MDGIEVEFAGRAEVVRLNVGLAENEHIQSAYNMRGHPSAVVVDREGYPTQQFFGVETAEVLRAALNGVAP